MTFPRAKLKRPMPPAALCHADEYGTFERSPEMERWLIDAFVVPGAPFYDEEHCHLQEARIGVLWSNIPVSRKGAPVAGTAQIPRPPSSLSLYDRQALLWFRRRFFGVEPLNFLITLDAPYAAEADHWSFCALAKHELVHCDQARDPLSGDRLFTGKDFRPVFTIRGHDVEEQISVVRDFGVVSRNVKEFVEAARKPPRIAQAKIDWGCGTCLARAA